MAIKAPGKLNLAASRRATERDSLFVDVPAEGSVQVRFSPPDESGIFFTRTVQHFKFKTDEGRGAAYACLKTHGDPKVTGKCAICDVVEHFKKSEVKAERELADAFNGFGPSTNFYAQVYVKGREDQGPKLLKLPPGATTDFLAQVAIAEQNGIAVPTDEGVVEGGQVKDPGGAWYVFGKRQENGKWKYTSMTTGRHQPLGAVDPEWREKFLDVQAALQLKVLARAEQVQALIDNFGTQLDLDQVAALRK